MNTIQIKGFVGNVDEIKYVGGNNSALLNFTVATNRMTKRPDPRAGTEAQFEATWHNVTVWGEKATELVATGYLKKGASVFVMGRQDNYQYPNREGVKVNATRIVANEVEILFNPKKLKERSTASAPPQQPQYAPPQPPPPPPPPPPPVYAPPAPPAQPAYQDPEDDLPF